MRNSGSYFRNLKSAIENRKWVGLSVIVFVLAVVGAAARAQQPKKVYRIGYLAPQDAPSESGRAEAVRLALRDLGYIEGQNIGTEYRYAENKTDRFPEVAAELVRLKVDVIVVSGGARLVLAAKNATKTIPIVMMAAGIDPVELGVIESIARPGGNVTGLTTLNRDLHGKRLELLKEAVPKLSRVAILYDAGAPNATRVKEDLPVAARALGLTVRPWEARDAASFDQVIAALNNERLDGLYLSTGRLINANQKRIVDFALKRRLASVFGNRMPVDAGGLMSYAADLEASYRRIAYYVDKILKGAKPADLPVELPTKFELVINLKTAKQIGVTIPQSVLYRADRVIK